MANEVQIGIRNDVTPRKAGDQTGQSFNSSLSSLKSFRLPAVTVWAGRLPWTSLSGPDPHPLLKGLRYYSLLLSHAVHHPNLNVGVGVPYPKERGSYS